MAKKKATEIVFILDRSGSMSHLADDTIGGFNSFVKEQQKLDEGDAFLTLVLFDDQYDIIYESKDIDEVPVLDNKTYYARGMTALNDAIGRTIASFKPKTKSSKVVFVVTTDGYENASTEYKNKQIKELIEEKKLKKNGAWEFLFLGANIDSFSVGDSYGVSAVHTSNFTATAKGMSTMYLGISRGISDYRSSTSEDATITEDWKEEIE